MPLPSHAVPAIRSTGFVRLSVVMAVAGVGTAAVVGFFVSSLAACLIMAILLMMMGVVRIIAPSPEIAEGLAVRRKPVDAFTYLALGIGIAVLAVGTPHLG